MVTKPFCKFRMYSSICQVKNIVKVHLFHTYDSIRVASQHIHLCYSFSVKGQDQPDIHKICKNDCVNPTAHSTTTRFAEVLLIVSMWLYWWFSPLVKSICAQYLLPKNSQIISWVWYTFSSPKTKSTLIQILT